MRGAGRSRTKKGRNAPNRVSAHTSLLGARGGRAQAGPARAARVAAARRRARAASSAGVDGRPRRGTRGEPRAILVGVWPLPALDNPGPCLLPSALVGYLHAQPQWGCTNWEMGHGLWMAGHFASRSKVTDL
eukprot:366067-Chlamydomonas_euryale.AAC.11